MRGLRFLVAGTAIALASCGDPADNGGSPGDTAEAAHEGPMVPISLQPIGYPDIEKNDLFGPSCAFAAGNGMAPLFLGMEDTGHIKMGDKVLTLAADPGSKRNVAGFPINYSGLAIAAQLEVEGQGRGFGDGGGLTYSGRLTVTDVKGRDIYQETGSVQCGA